jgi:hypothetical protein
VKDEKESSGVVGAVDIALARSAKLRPSSRSVRSDSSSSGVALRLAATGDGEKLSSVEADDKRQGTTSTTL